ncbi:MAG TPA: DUF4383 domain-containing protein [Candidatus Limnocylindrales bacterium]|nr:DUF4383 domain-containing protein [Candidatus Limnocylindrales bacterium]
MLKKAAMATGVVFLLIGVLGFTPLAFESEGVKKLLGLFQVDAVHNLVHILSGIVFLAASQTERFARTAFQVFGVVYALVTLIGFMVGDGGTVLGLFHVNTLDNLLHLVLAAAFLYLGFGVPADRRANSAV